MTSAPDGGPDADEPDDGTIVVRRPGVGAPDEIASGDEPDDGTIVVRRNAAGEPEAGAPEAGEPEAGEPDATPAADDATELVRRDAHGERPRRTPVELDAETGSTVVVRRESRRRAEAAAKDAEADLDDTLARGAVRGLPATAGDDVPAPLDRVARTPTSPDSTYGIRRSDPVIVRRTPVPAHPPQTPADGAAYASAQRGRSRRRAVILVGAVVCAVLGAIAVIAVLALQG